MPILSFLTYQNTGLGRFDKYFSPNPSVRYSVEVAENVFMRQDYRDSIWFALKHLPLYNKALYEYSDVNMVLLQQTIDTINQVPINEYLSEAIYTPLGLRNMTFKPRESFNARQIVPTENDRWRGQLLRGHVHDPSAALLGGVAGNAGLFSNAYDLGILFQMILNNGQYGGKQYLSPATVSLFTSRQKGHRGLGFDMRPAQGNYIIGDSVSMTTYGHTGFTGTCVWVDPEEDLIFVFLSNRVYPSSRNWRINTFRIRQRIHNVVYQAIRRNSPKQSS